MGRTYNDIKTDMEKVQIVIEAMNICFFFLIVIATLENDDRKNSCRKHFVDFTSPYCNQKADKTKDICESERATNWSK